MKRRHAPVRRTIVGTDAYRSQFRKFYLRDIQWSKGENYAMAFLAGVGVIVGAVALWLASCLLDVALNAL